MLNSLNTAVSGLEGFQYQMDVLGNNIANVNTVGFKGARADMAESFSQTLDAAGGAASGGAQQVGSGVNTSSVENMFTQGALTKTDLKTDLAISGDGFFVVRNSVTNGQYATRAGDFHLDSDGFLVTSNGDRVQGFSDSALSAIGDIKIDDAGKPAAASPTAQLSSYTIDNQGKISVQLSDGTQFVRGQLLLQNFRNPQALVNAGDNLFSGIESASPLGGQTPTPAAPQSNGLGSISSGYLEMSNVDLASQFANLIATQRGFQANARMISASDQLMQEIVNLVH